MKTIYEAFDGTRFETPEGCEKYENLHSYDSLEMLDAEYSPTTDFDAARFIIVRNDIDRQRVENLLVFYGNEYDDIEAVPTVIAWNNYSEKWEDLPVKVERLEGMLTKLKEILSMVKENEK